MKTGLPYSFDGTIVAGGAAVVVDLYANLQGKARGFFVVNDGPGNLSVEVSNDGTNYGSAFLVGSGEQYSFPPFTHATGEEREKEAISRIRLDDDGANTTYRGQAR